MMFTGWSTPLGLLKEELGQRAYEGHPVPESLRDKVAAIEDAYAMNIAIIDLAILIPIICYHCGIIVDIAL